MGEKFVPIEVKYDEHISGSYSTGRYKFHNFKGVVAKENINPRDCSHIVDDGYGPDYDLEGTCDLTPDGFPHYRKCSRSNRQAHWCKPSLTRDARSKEEFDRLKAEFAPNKSEEAR